MHLLVILNIMTLTTRVTQHFTDAIDLFQKSSETLAPLTAQAIDVLFNTLANDGRILACGNGGSAADAQHFVGELVGRFEHDRIPLAAIALTADTVTLSAVANDFGYNQVFAQQVNALGQAGDSLVAISTSGNSENVIQAILAAHSRDMNVIALTGKEGGKITELLGEHDIHLCVPHHRTLRIQEVHMMLLHAMCDGIDAQLLGEV